MIKQKPKPVQAAKKEESEKIEEEKKH